jgi:hypothetical protein
MPFQGVPVQQGLSEPVLQHDILQQQQQGILQQQGVPVGPIEQQHPRNVQAQGVIRTAGQQHPHQEIIQQQQQQVNHGAQFQVQEVQQQLVAGAQGGAPLSGNHQQQDANINGAYHPSAGLNSVQSDRVPAVQDQQQLLPLAPSDAGHVAESSKGTGERAKSTDESSKSTDRQAGDEVHEGDRVPGRDLKQEKEGDEEVEKEQQIKEEQEHEQNDEEEEGAAAKARARRAPAAADVLCENDPLCADKFDRNPLADSGLLERSDLARLLRLGSARRTLLALAEPEEDARTGGAAQAERNITSRGNGRATTRGLL